MVLFSLGSEQISRSDTERVYVEEERNTGLINSVFHAGC